MYIMESLMVILSLTAWLVTGVPDGSVDTEDTTNSSDPNKDMYVIHAMVYQVGILTNKTDDEAANANMTGNEEAVTFYHTNGSNIDLSKIPAPLLTNITAQRMVGVAPASAGAGAVPIAPGQSRLPWTTLDHLASLQQPSAKVDTGNGEPRLRRTPVANYQFADQGDSEADGNPQQNLPYYVTLMRRSVENSKADDQTPVKILKGTAVIPQDAGVQSIAIPPLLTLNNNFSEIPVPIPNTSIVHYAKVNTLIKTP